jgi:glycine oxidase
MVSTNKTATTADVVIIGGGVIGLTVARALALRGVSDTCLIERGILGNEASSAAAGMLAPQAEADSCDQFFDLACRSRALYPNFAAALLEDTGTDIELDSTGTLYLGFTDHDQNEIEERYNWQTRAGLPVEKLSPAEARELEPCINPDLYSALRFPLDTQVENRRLLSALANSVGKSGVKIMAQTRVESVLVRSGRVDGVITTRGLVSCARVIVAAGCWTSFIGVSGVAEKSRSTWRVDPVRGQMVCFETKPQVARHVIYSPRGYVVPRRDGRLLAGSTSEDAGFAKQITGGGINAILRNALEISPSVSELPIVDSWAGLRPRAPDGLPVMGPCDEIAGLFYATGHYRNGILLAPITGELIAQAVVGEGVSSLFASFGPNRFRSLGS